MCCILAVKKLYYQVRMTGNLPKFQLTFLLHDPEEFQSGIVADAVSTSPRFLSLPPQHPVVHFYTCLPEGFSRAMFSAWIQRGEARGKEWRTYIPEYSQLKTDGRGAQMPHNLSSRVNNFEVCIILVLQVPGITKFHLLTVIASLITHLLLLPFFPWLTSSPTSVSCTSQVIYLHLNLRVCFWLQTKAWYNREEEPS